MGDNSVCRFLAWDSEFFGYRIARATTDRLTDDTAKEMIGWCQTNRIDCLYFLGSANDPTTPRVAEDSGFRFVDMRLTFDRFLSRYESDSTETAGFIRTCRVPDDVRALRSMARVNYRDSRFFFDPNFPTSLSEMLYETWIEKSCFGYAEIVLVAEIQGEAAGYISCHIPQPDRGEIGLVGVAVHHQGRGIGHRLVSASLRWFAEQGVTRVSVVTQGRNCQAQRLYQRCGFLTRSVQLWFHRWFP